MLNVLPTRDDDHLAHYITGCALLGKGDCSGARASLSRVITAMRGVSVGVDMKGGEGARDLKGITLFASLKAMAYIEAASGHYGDAVALLDECISGQSYMPAECLVLKGILVACSSGDINGAITACRQALAIQKGMHAVLPLLNSDINLRVPLSLFCHFFMFIQTAPQHWQYLFLYSASSLKEMTMQSTSAHAGRMQIDSLVFSSGDL
jgi:hypothetical protein